jgi:hypothetical protein
MKEPADPEAAAYAAQFTRRPAAARHFLIDLHKFFPPDDKFATCVARLCMLREDLFLEVHGITFGPYEWLDKNGEVWRRNYFFRNSVRTLQEIKSAIHTLKCLPEFQRTTKTIWSAQDQTNFANFYQEIEKASELLKDVRNSVGAHVEHEVVKRALKGLGPGTTGYWVCPHHHDDKPTHTHYPFLNVILIAMLQDSNRNRRDLDEVMKIPEVMASLINAIAFIDNIFELYVVERGLPQP